MPIIDKKEKKLLGTHNSLSYLKPKQWWLRPFAWMARCQDLTIKQQWDLGVRYFDIRIKYDKNKLAKSGHGIMTYDVLIDDVLELINSYANASKERAIVRLFHENKRSAYWKDRLLFIDLCAEAIAKFPNITFIEGGCRHKYTSVIDMNVPSRICYAEYYKKKFCIPYPKCWAGRNNHRLHRGDNTEEWSVYDFVEI